MHPGFGKKTVLKVRCRFCQSIVCNRGMKAVLLADTKQELFSTDAPVQMKVGSLGRTYSTNQCQCRICDIACKQCGNVVGYHVEVPCITCLQSCHNGHMWIFNSDAIATEEIVDKSGRNVLKWDQIAASPCEEETESLDSSLDDLTDLECFR
ncbi:Protein FAM72A [Holothuria leucospilota]|uniref:Protein FAM72A n=1 Tax=Holothuria leucospilota TaxID=206669 RepID=A0A9Q1CMZ2_HOLLE|nr:Protein FAM72A [Holothuria leucospilota]